MFDPRYPTVSEQVRDANVEALEDFMDKVRKAKDAYQTALDTFGREFMNVDDLDDVMGSLEDEFSTVQAAFEKAKERTYDEAA